MSHSPGAGPTCRVPMQKAWIVTDIERAALGWSQALNIGPFFVSEFSPEQFVDLEYRQGPGHLHMKTAICYAGDEQIELIQPLSDLPCAYSDTVPFGQSGFHHLCFYSDDLATDIAHYEAQGFPQANRGQMRGGPHFAYVDTSAGLGCMVELLERSAGIEKHFARWQQACADWDGQQAIVHV